MNDEQTQYYALLGMVASMPQEAQDQINKARQDLKNIITANGDHGQIAIALVGMETALNMAVSKE